MKKLLLLFLSIATLLVMCSCENSVGKEKKACIANDTIHTSTNGTLTNASKVRLLHAGDMQSTLTPVGTLMQRLGIKQESGIVSLTGIDGEIIASFSLPITEFLKDAYYDTANKSLVLVFLVNDSGQEIEETVVIEVGDLIHEYAPGDGLQLSENQFSIKLDAETENFVTVWENGLKLTGIDAALEGKADTADLGNYLPLSGGIIDTKNTWGGLLKIGRNSSNPEVGSNMGVIGVTDGGLHIDSGTGKSIYFNFYTSGSSWDSAVTIRGDGNLGVGLMSPAEKIETTGNVKANSFINANSNNDSILLAGGGRKAISDFGGDSPVSYLSSISYNGTYFRLATECDNYVFVKDNYVDICLYLQATSQFSPGTPVFSLNEDMLLPANDMRLGVPCFSEELGAVIVRIDMDYYGDANIPTQLGINDLLVIKMSYYNHLVPR